MIRYRSTAGAGRSSSNAGNVTPSKPSGTINDDWMIAVGSSSGGTLTPPAGWTQLYLNGSSTRGVWSKLAASEGSNYDWATSAFTDGAYRVDIITYRGGDTARPPTVGAATTATSASLTGASVTIPFGAGVLLLAGMEGADNDEAVITSTVTSDLKERVDQNEVNTTSTGGHAHVSIASTRVIQPGASGSKVATISASKDNTGILVILYQPTIDADDAPGEVEVLLEVDVYDEGVPGVVTKLYSQRGMIYPDHTFYESRVMSRVTVAQMASNSVAHGGNVALTATAIDLRNDDEVLDEIAERSTALGRAVLVKTMPIVAANRAQSDGGGGDLSGASTVFTGMVGGWAPRRTHMGMILSGLGSRLNVPLATEHFDGTAGLGGDAELSGLPEPICIGEVYNIAPVALGTVDVGDGSLDTYMVNFRNVNSIDTVRESGVPLTEVGGVPTVGQWRSHAATGIFQLGFSPSGVITCDVKGDDPAFDIYANQTSEVIERLLALGPGLPDSFLEIDTFTDVDTLMPGIIGLYIGPIEISAAEAIESVLRHANLWLATGRNGLFRLNFADPVIAPEIQLREFDIVELEPVAMPAQLQPAPVHVDITCGKNWAPLLLSDVAGSVSPSQRRKLMNPGRTVTSMSSSLDTRQEPDRRLLLPGLFKTNADAQTRADAIIAWIAGGLRAIKVTTERYRNVVEVGLGVYIPSYPRYGLSGFTGIVCEWEEEPATGRVTMTLIGRV